MSGNWDYMFRAYRGGRIQIEVGLSGPHSMEMEWQAGQNLLRSGAYDRITMHDQRPLWRRENDPDPRYREVVSRDEGSGRMIDVEFTARGVELVAGRSLWPGKRLPAARAEAVVGRAPRCSVQIRNPVVRTAEQERREARARRAGAEPTQCLCRATHKVDGRPMCRAHAGRAALRILMGEE